MKLISYLFFMGLKKVDLFVQMVHAYLNPIFKMALKLLLERIFELQNDTFN